MGGDAVMLSDTDETMLKFKRRMSHTASHTEVVEVMKRR